MVGQDSISEKHGVTGFTPREILMKYLPYLPWIIASVLICLILAFIKLRYSPNIYNVSGTILVMDPNPYGSKADKFDDIFMAQNNRNLNDEMQVIRSRGMAKRVVKSLRLETQYYNQGKIRSTLIHNNDSPIELDIISMADSGAPFTIPVTVLNNNEFKISEQGPALQFGKAVQLGNGVFSIKKRPNVDANNFASANFFISYSPADYRASELVGSLYAVQSGESDNIMEINYVVENTKVGIDIINQWMREYQLAGLEDKRQIASNTLSFIGQQLDTVKYDLGGVEKNLLGYREKNRVISPEQQGIQVFQTISELEKELTKQSVQLQVVENLIKYISDDSSPYRQVASLLGIEEPSLAQQIGEFNRLQVQRETLLKTTTRSNPMIVDLETAIEKLRINILQNLKNVKSTYQVGISSLTSRNNAAVREVSQIPGKEKQLLDIVRRQKILEELYSYLLQKKLETSISSASTISNVRVIEPAMSSDIPVEPNRRTIYLTALFIGLLIPSLIIFLVDYLNDRVNSREDIQKVTSAPIIGEVGHSEEKSSLVVSKTSRRFIAEQFRIIRTNLQYILPKQEKSVILITSSSSGEGKSFISTNIGAVMSLAGKKTAILEFDIRKPKIMSAFSLAQKAGITNFIIGVAGYEDLAVQVPGIENLFIIPCGPVPPNPSELLLNPRVDELMARLKQDYDVIIIDTAPIGLVSDAVMLGKYADASLYVIRHNYTYKKQIQLLNEIYANKRLPNLSLIINDISAQESYGRYYGYGGSGYGGYGYGYGSEYFEESSKNGILGKISGIFSRKRS